MRKIHDVLRLHFGLHLPQRQIARSVKLSQSTIHDYIGRFEKCGLSWPLPADSDDVDGPFRRDVNNVGAKRRWHFNDAADYSHR